MYHDKEGEHTHWLLHFKRTVRRAMIMKVIPLQKYMITANGGKRQRISRSNKKISELYQGEGTAMDIDRESEGVSRSYKGINWDE